VFDGLFVYRLDVSRTEVDTSPDRGRAERQAEVLRLEDVEAIDLVVPLPVRAGLFGVGGDKDAASRHRADDRGHSPARPVLPLTTLAKATSAIILVVFASVNLALFRIQKADPDPDGEGPRLPRWLPLTGFVFTAAVLLIQT